MRVKIVETSNDLPELEQLINDELEKLKSYWIADIKVINTGINWGRQDDREMPTCLSAIILYTEKKEERI